MENIQGYIEYQINFIENREFPVLHCPTKHNLHNQRGEQKGRREGDGKGQEKGECMKLVRGGGDIHVYMLRGVWGNVKTEREGSKNSHFNHKKVE